MVHIVLILVLASSVQVKLQFLSSPESQIVGARVPKSGEVCLYIYLGSLDLKSESFHFSLYFRIKISFADMTPTKWSTVLGITVSGTYIFWKLYNKILGSKEIHARICYRYNYKINFTYRCLSNKALKIWSNLCQEKCYLRRK